MAEGAEAMGDGIPLLRAAGITKHFGSFTANWSGEMTANTLQGFLASNSNIVNTWMSMRDTYTVASATLPVGTPVDLVVNFSGHAFLTEGPAMVRFLEQQGLPLVTCPGYSDYYSNAKGGSDIGRGLEPKPWNGKKLGLWLAKLQPGLAQSLGMAVMTNEARSLSNYNRSLRAFGQTIQ